LNDGTTKISEKVEGVSRKEITGLIIRERRHFWSSKPSSFLLLAIAADLVLVFFISIFGLPGIVPIAPVAALAVAGLSFVIVFLINDPIKVLLIRKFWQRL